MNRKNVYLSSLRRGVTKMLGGFIDDETWQYVISKCEPNFLYDYNEIVKDSYLKSDDENKSRAENQHSDLIDIGDEVAESSDIDEVVVEIEAYREVLQHHARFNPEGLPRNIKTSRYENRTRYAKSFSNRYDIYLFVYGERHSNPSSDHLLKNGKKPIQTWNQMWNKFKISLNPTTGEPYDYIPPTAKAFEMQYRISKMDFGEINDEDFSDIIVHTFLNSLEAALKGDLQHEFTAKDLLKSYDMIRDKKNNIIPAWRGKITDYDIYKVLASIAEYLETQRPPGTESNKAIYEIMSMVTSNAPKSP